LKSGFIIVFEFDFANFRGRVDAPQWEIQIDETTQQYKYKLHIANAEDLTEADFAHIEGHPPPDDLAQRPTGYNPAWQLGWRYSAHEGQNIIQIFRVDGGATLVIHTLRPENFTFGGAQDWFRQRLPIVLHKHKTYVLVCPSLWLARANEVRKGYSPDKLTDPRVDFYSYTMTAKETVWVSEDDAVAVSWVEHHARRAERKRKAEYLAAMLAWLHEVADG
jgi:hypothetical protein